MASNKPVLTSLPYFKKEIPDYPVDRGNQDHCCYLFLRSYDIKGSSVQLTALETSSKSEGVISAVN